MTCNKIIFMLESVCIIYKGIWYFIYVYIYICNCKLLKEGLLIVIKIINAGVELDKR